jgi:phage recombination protein Bet
MTTAVAQIPAQRVSLLAKIAGRYGVEPAKMMDTLKATAFKVKDGAATNEQMMALLIVADQYQLNPFTKEIYAFPDKGGIVPVVGVDGWARIINEHPQFDGMSFGMLDDGSSCTCVIYRKDRSHPISVTEYMSECKRGTQPWQSHPKRMLRHKAMIQCARMAFGFAGIYDPDEAERMVVQMGAADEVRKPSGLAAVRAAIATTSAEHVADPETGEIKATGRTLSQFKAAIDNAADAESAALELDSARDVLDSTDNAALAEHYRAAWNAA